MEALGKRDSAVLEDSVHRQAVIMYWCAEHTSIMTNLQGTYFFIFIFIYNWDFTTAFTSFLDLPAQKYYVPFQ